MKHTIYTQNKQDKIEFPPLNAGQAFSEALIPTRV